MSTDDATGNAVLITGASTGIGHGAAVELARRGFQVFAGVRRMEDARRLNEHAIPLLLDVTDAAAIADATQMIAAAVGEAGLMGLVNNAGIAVVGPLELVPIDEWRRQFEVNVLGAVAVTQAVMPLLRAGKGRVVNISSVSGLVAVPFFGPYTASKFALEAISDALRLEVQRFGMHVSLIEPGSVQTPIWDKSRRRVERQAEAARPEYLDLYEEDLEAIRRAGRKAEEEAIPVEVVVRVIAKTLTARRPRARYVVPRSECFACGLLRSLPTRLRDWLMRKAIGLK